MKTLILLIAVLCFTSTRAQLDTTTLTRQQQAEVYMEKSKNAKSAAITLLVIGGICGTVGTIEAISSFGHGFPLATSTEERKKADAQSITALAFVTVAAGFYTWSYFTFRTAKKYKRKAESMMKPEVLHLPGKSDQQMIAIGIRLHL